MVECSLSPKKNLYESYVVKYWDRSGEYVIQNTQTVYTRSKNKHKQVEAFIMKTFNVKQQDIVSVIYQ